MRINAQLRETIAYLRQITRAEARVSAYIIKADRYRSLATRAGGGVMSLDGGVKMSAVDGGGMQETVAILLDLAADMEQAAQETRAAVAAVRDVIARVPDQRMRDLLAFRYINDWRWWQIERALHYGTTQVKNLHCAALKAVEMLLIDRKS